MISLRILTTIGCLLVIGSTCYCQVKKKHLGLTSGLDFSSMRGTDTNGTRVYFPETKSFRFGIQAEFPIKSGRWAIVLDPNLQWYKVARPYYLRYRSLETPLGVRRYFSINKKTGFFVNGSVVGDFILEHSMELLPTFYFRSSKFATNFAAGAGLAVGRFSLEYRHYSQRTRDDDSGSFTYNFNKRSVIVAFRLY